MRRVSLPGDPGRHIPLVVTEQGGQGLTAMGAAPDPVCSVVALDFDEPPEVGA